MNLARFSPTRWFAKYSHLQLLYNHHVPRLVNNKRKKSTFCHPTTWIHLGRAGGQGLKKKGPYRRRDSAPTFHRSPPASSSRWWHSTIPVPCSFSPASPCFSSVSFAPLSSAQGESIKHNITSNVPLRRKRPCAAFLY